MDTMVKGIDVKSNKLMKIMTEIMNIDGFDGINFEITRLNDIRIQDRYGEIRLALLGVKEELRVNLKIDITTKDPIIPREINFKYKSMFDNSYIDIMAFSKESIIAEKFETLLEDTESDTRAKDFYDLYMLMNDKIDYDNLRKAIISTLKRREREYLLDEILERFEIIKNSNILERNWKNYQRGHIYSKGIDYKDIIMKINIIVDIVVKIPN